MACTQAVRRHSLRRFTSSPTMRRGLTPLSPPLLPHCPDSPRPHHSSPASGLEQPDAHTSNVRKLATPSRREGSSASGITIRIIEPTPPNRQHRRSLSDLSNQPCVLEQRSDDLNKTDRRRSRVRPTLTPYPSRGQLDTLSGDFGDEWAQVVAGLNEILNEEEKRFGDEEEDTSALDDDLDGGEAQQAVFYAEGNYDSSDDECFVDAELEDHQRGPRPLSLVSSWTFGRGDHLSSLTGHIAEAHAEDRSSSSTPELPIRSNSLISRHALSTPFDSSNSSTRPSHEHLAATFPSPFCDLPLPPLPGSSISLGHTFAAKEDSPTVPPIAQRRGRPMSPIAIPARDPHLADVKPSGYHSEASSEEGGTRAVGPFDGGGYEHETGDGADEDEEAEEDQDTPRQSQRRPPPVFPLTEATAGIGLNALPSTPPPTRQRATSTHSLLRNAFPSTSTSSPEIANEGYFVKASPSVAQSPGKVLVSSVGSGDWKLRAYAPGGGPRRGGSEGVTRGGVSH